MCSTDGQYGISGLPDDEDGVGPRNAVYFKSVDTAGSPRKFF